MRNFLLRLVMFSLPFWAMAGYLAYSDPPRSEAYEQIQKDCRSGSWIYKRLYERPEPVDVALIGTSRTMCGLEDDVMEQFLVDSLNRDWRVANLGVCRNGVNLHALLMRDLLLQKRPQKVVVEVHSVMPTNGHMHFPYLAQVGDVFWPQSFLNTSVPADWVTFAWYRLCHHREKLLGIHYRYDETLTDGLHSFMRVPDDVVADSAEMDKVRARRQKITSQPPKGIAGLWKEILDVFPMAYYEEMALRCKDAGIDLYFLYLPGYGTQANRPQELHFYENLGSVLLPPDSIFVNPENFFDPDHLNQKGARMLSKWLSQQIADGKK